MQRAHAVLEPRKTPVQARSVASVDAILEATLQVLLQVGKERLTTTRVASRAGVSVGTLYQYFPNKSALLQAALRRHMVEVAEAVELACKEQRGARLQPMVTAVITAFLTAKMKNAKTSVALYSVSSDVDGAKIVQQMGTRINQAILRMLASSSESLATRSTACRLDASGNDGWGEPQDPGVERAGEAVRDFATGTDLCGVRLCGCLLDSRFDTGGAARR